MGCSDVRFGADAQQGLHNGCSVAELRRELLLNQSDRLPQSLIMRYGMRFYSS
jgi:hypothetical protein